jgi:hypothetical protein
LLRILLKPDEIQQSMAATASPIKAVCLATSDIRTIQDQHAIEEKQHRFAKALEVSAAAAAIVEHFTGNETRVCMYLFILCVIRLFLLHHLLCLWAARAVRGACPLVFLFCSCSESCQGETSGPGLESAYAV